MTTLGTMFQLSDIQKIGIGLSAFGISFIFLGVALFFDRGLLAIGNILFISGLTCIIGVFKTIVFFFQVKKLKATSFFFGGIFIVLLGWAFIGMILEMYGFVLLFSGFFPAVISFLRRAPLLGTVMNMPGISGLMDKVTVDPYPAMV